jgi:hypothetical protein
VKLLSTGLLGRLSTLSYVLVIRGRDRLIDRPCQYRRSAPGAGRLATNEIAVRLALPTTPGRLALDVHALQAGQHAPTMNDAATAVLLLDMAY